MTGPHTHDIRARPNCTNSLRLNQSQSGNYVDAALGSAAKTVIPANAGIQGRL